MGLANLPLASGDKHAKAFEYWGWVRVRTKNKNHIILEKDGVTATLSIPNHKGKDVKRALLQSQIKLAGLTEAQYLQGFKK